MKTKEFTEEKEEKTVTRFYTPTPKWREGLYFITNPFIKLIGSINLNFKKVYMGSDDHYEEIKELVRPGMVIVSHNNWEFTNPFIDGYWDHAALIINTNNDIVEAVDPVVRTCNLQKFIKRHDYILLLDPCFANKDRMIAAAKASLELVGKPYDKKFVFSLKRNAEIYCSEVVWWSYETTYKYVGEYSPFVPRKFLGQYMILPQDLVDSFILWKPVYSNHPKHQLENPEDPQKES